MAHGHGADIFFFFFGFCEEAHIIGRSTAKRNHATR